MVIIKDNIIIDKIKFISDIISLTICDNLRHWITNFVTSIYKLLITLNMIRYPEVTNIGKVT